MNLTDAIFIRSNPLIEIRARMHRHTRHGVYGVDDAIMIAGLAASAAGTGMSMAGQQESADAMERARANFRLKQQQLQEDANKVFAKSKSMATIASTDETLAKGAAQRGQIVKALQQASTPMATALPSNPATGYQVSDPGAAAAQAAGNATRTANTAAANTLGAYDDWSNQNQLNAADAARNMAPISSKSQGNARVFPTQLEAASHKGDNLSQWGQIVGALGSVAGGVSGLLSAPTAAVNAVTPITSVAQYPASASMWSGITQAATQQAARQALYGVPSLWSSMIAR